jgi:hypothetical protein
VDCDVLVLHLPETGEGLAQEGGGGEGGEEKVEPQFLEVVHEVGEDGLEAEEEEGEAEVDGDAGDHLEEGTDTVNGREVLHWTVPVDHYRARVVVQGLAVGVVAGGGKEAGEEGLRGVDGVVEFGGDQFRVLALEGEGGQEGVCGRVCLQSVDNAVVVHDAVGEALVVEQEHEDLLEERGVVVAVGATEGHHHVERLVVVVAYAVSEGVAQT